MRIGSIDIEMFAPCGMNCTVCYKHCHTRKIQKPCSGCMQENKSKPVHCRKCKIKDCVQLKEITYCYQCGDFPCRLIRNLEKSYNSRYDESLVENSEIVKGNGVFYFMETHSARYTCTECGGIVSLHDKVCTECGKRTR